MFASKTAGLLQSHKKNFYCASGSLAYRARKIIQQESFSIVGCKQGLQINPRALSQVKLCNDTHIIGNSVETCNQPFMFRKEMNY